LNTFCLVHRIEYFASAFLIAEKLINIEKKMVPNIIEKVPHQSKRYNLFAKTLSHAFYYF